MPPVIAVVIPVYNHREGLRDVVQRALNQCGTVIAVDDGSTDGSADSLEGLPITLVRLPRNGGKGAALLAGAAEAARLGVTHIITLDADGQHYPEDIPFFLQAIAQHPNAIIVGCRDFNVPHVPGSSRFGRAFSAFWMRVQTGERVRDMQSGFRAYPLRVLDCLKFTEPGYAFEVEVLVRAAWAGFDVREIDIRVYYPPREERVSHFKALKDNIRISLLNTRLTIRALVPVPFRQHSVDEQGRISLLHPMDSLRRLLADRATPLQLGRSAAVAIAVSTLPLPGLQSILLLLCIGWLRLNRLCALAMIPLTWPPFVPGLGVLLGYRLRKGSWLTEFSVQTLGYEAPQRILDWFVGALVLAPLLGLLAGAGVGALAYLAARGMTRMRQEGAAGAAMQNKRPVAAALGSRLQYGFFEVLVRCRMVFAARIVLAFVVLYYAMLPHVRQRCAAYIDRRFPHAGAWSRFVHAYRLYLNFGQVLLDRMIAGVTGRFPFCETDQHVRQRFAEAGTNPHGCIVLTAHIGAWQVGIAGLEQFDRPVNVVQLHNPEDQGKHYFQHGKGRPFKIIDSADPVGSMVEAAAALRRREVVCLMGDRLHGTRQAGQGVDVAFMGGSIRIPASAYALASITGAELLMLFTVREKGVTRVFMAERLAVPAGLPRRDVSVFQPYAQQFAAALETVVERHPYQFFNFYDMWSQ